MPTALVTLFAFGGCSDDSSDSGLSGATSAATDSPSTTWLTTDGTASLTTDGTTSLATGGTSDDSSDPPDGSTGTDGPPPPPGHPPWDPPRHTFCGGMDNDDVPTGDDVLVLDGCVRVTPELVEHEDEVRSDTPRCAFANRLGSVGVDVAGDGIRLLYCDDDKGGGVRFARVNVVTGAIQRVMTKSGHCWTDLDTGGLHPIEGGYLAYWSWPEEPNGGDMVSNLWTSTTDLDGVSVELPSIVPAVGGTLPWRLESIEGALLELDQDERGLWYIPLAPNGTSDGDPVLVMERAWTYAPLRRDDGTTWVGVCTLEDRMQLLVLDAAGSVLSSRDLEVDCYSLDSQPVLVAGDTGALLGWHDLYAVQLRFLDDTGADVEHVDLGSGTQGLGAAWQGGRYVTMDRGGTVLSWSSDGQQQGAWRHPMVVAADGLVDRVRLRAADEAIVFVAKGTDAISLPAGCQNMWNWLEVSRAEVPAP